MRPGGSSEVAASEEPFFAVGAGIADVIADTGGRGWSLTAV